MRRGMEYCVPTQYTVAVLPAPATIAQWFTVPIAL